MGFIIFPLLIFSTTVQVSWVFPFFSDLLWGCLGGKKAWYFLRSIDTKNIVSIRKRFSAVSENVYVRLVKISVAVNLLEATSVEWQAIESGASYKRCGWLKRNSECRRERGEQRLQGGSWYVKKRGCPLYSQVASSLFVGEGRGNGEGDECRGWLCHLHGG